MDEPSLLTEVVPKNKLFFQLSTLLALLAFLLALGSLLYGYVIIRSAPVATPDKVSPVPSSQNGENYGQLLRGTQFPLFIGTSTLVYTQPVFLSEKDLNFKITWGSSTEYMSAERQLSYVRKLQSDRSANLQSEVELANKNIISAYSVGGISLDVIFPTSTAPNTRKALEVFVADAASVANNLRLKLNYARPIDIDKTVDQLIATEAAPSTPDLVTFQATIITMFLVRIDPTFSNYYFAELSRIASNQVRAGITFPALVDFSYQLGLQYDHQLYTAFSENRMPAHTAAMFSDIRQNVISEKPQELIRSLLVKKIPLVKEPLKVPVTIFIENVEL